MAWTRFFDMASGGSDKEDWSVIYIEAEYDEACDFFQKRFGRNPHNVTCDCCGGDYSIRSCGEPIAKPTSLIIDSAEMEEWIKND